MPLPCDRSFDRGQRRLGASSIGAARLRHVGAPAAALAAERGGAAAHQLDRIEPTGQIWCDADNDRRLAVGSGDDRDNAGADAPLQIVGQRFELTARDAVDDAAVESNAVNKPARLGGSLALTSCVAGSRSDPPRFG
jgi:hypothetical protein